MFWEGYSMTDRQTMYDALCSRHSLFLRIVALCDLLLLKLGFCKKILMSYFNSEIVFAVRRWRPLQFGGSHKQWKQTVVQIKWSLNKLMIPWGVSRVWTHKSVVTVNTHVFSEWNVKLTTLAHFISSLFANTLLNKYCTRKLAVEMVGKID
jgi:hypothetical protein